MADEIPHGPVPNSPIATVSPTNVEEDFIVCGAIKSRKFVLFVAMLGASLCVMLGVILITILPWFAFPTGMDVLILSGIGVYVVGGVIASVFVYFGTKKNRPGLFTPFLLLYGTLIMIGMGAAVVGVAKLVSDQSPEVDTLEAISKIIIIVVPVFVLTQILLIYFIWQYKRFLTWKLQRRVVMPVDSYYHYPNCLFIMMRLFRRKTGRQNDVQKVARETKSQKNKRVEAPSCGFCRRVRKKHKQVAKQTIPALTIVAEPVH